MGVVRCALTCLPIKEPGISRYCESCNREFLDEVFCQEATQDKASPRTGLAVDNDQENRDGYIVVDPVPEAMDVDNTRDTNIIGEELDAVTETGFANTLFAIFHVCPYCQSKYVG